ncbi:MAG: ribosomal protein S18-alanine N-acetyltransferase [Pyrinomonadaceae bacterium]
MELGTSDGSASGEPPTAPRRANLRRLRVGRTFDGSASGELGTLHVHMAVIQKIKEFFEPKEPESLEAVVPAAKTTYSIKPLRKDRLPDLLSLSVRSFKGSESYNRDTFEYLLNEPRFLGYQAVSAEGALAGFIFIAANNGSIAHVTTVAVAPEHRKRGIGAKLMEYSERALRSKGLDSVVLEVRVSNYGAQNLYTSLGYVIIQKIQSYYSDGEDAFLMSKSIVI